jgi:hypothetical protein
MSPLDPPPHSPSRALSRMIHAQGSWRRSLPRLRRHGSAASRGCRTRYSWTAAYFFAGGTITLIRRWLTSAGGQESASQMADRLDRLVHQFSFDAGMTRNCYLTVPDTRQMAA